MRPHTPGPWTAGENGWSVYGPEGEEICELMDTFSGDNLDLLAAAPDLLEALQEAVWLYGKDDPSAYSWIRKALPAIAKALGTQDTPPTGVEGVSR